MPMKGLTACVSVERLTEGKQRKTKDVVVKETFLKVFLNKNQDLPDGSQELVTLLCSPSNPEYLATGFLLSEGLIETSEDLISIKFQKDKGIFVRLKDSKILRDYIRKKQAIASSCARVKINSWAKTINLGPKVKNSLKVKPQKIFSLMEEFKNRSELFNATGGVHLAALSDDKNIIVFQEDIGRHNAIDKVFGECFLKHIPLEDKLILTSGRISSEILIKVARMRLPMIISKAAPTNKAIALAKRLGITLIAFVRDKRMNIYTHPFRVFRDPSLRSG